MNIDKLIYDALAARRPVALPEAGTLAVKWRGAKKISDTQIVPPHNEVVFSSAPVEGEESVVALIAAAEGVPEEEAAEFYAAWLDGARREDGYIAIEGVGETAGEGGFVVAEPLYTQLNPINEEIVIMETSRKSSPLWVWIIIGVVVALLLVAGLVCWKTGVFGGKEKPVVETVVVPAAQPAVDTQPAAPDTADTATTTPTTSGPRFHVIAGAFSIESNADNFIAKLKREHPELTVEKIVNPDNGFNMVSIFQSPTRRAASSKMNLYWDIDLYLWIYEEK